MKKVKISQVLKEKNKYIIFLESGKAFEFQSKKSANKFLNEANRYLTDLLILLNDVNIKLYEHYRRNIFVINSLLIENSLSRQFIELNDCFSWILKRPGSENYSSHTFNKINLIFNNLNSIAANVISIAVKNRDTVTINQMKMTINCIEKYYFDFDKWIIKENPIKVIKTIELKNVS